jgi:hypothetical protein
MFNKILSSFNKYKFERIKMYNNLIDFLMFFKGMLKSRKKELLI